MAFLITLLGIGTNTASLVANSDAHIRYVVEDKDIINLGIGHPNNKLYFIFSC